LCLAAPLIAGIGAVVLASAATADPSGESAQSVIDGLKAKGCQLLRVE
jgi:hypothetical protein